MPQWRYQADGGVYTVEEEELRSLIATGKLDGSAMVQRMGADRWMTARTSDIENSTREPAASPTSSPPVGPPPLSGDLWYFERGGQRIGPHSAEQLRDLHRRGDISDATLVWRDGFGQQWKRLSEADLGIGPAAGPPPLPVSHLNSTFAWLFAFVPLVGLIIENVVRTNRAQSDVPAPAIFICYAAAYILLGALDAREVERSGRVKRSVAMRGLVWFAPAYLFQRARALGQKQWLLGGWFVAFLASIAIQSPEILKGNVYLGLGLPTCEGSASTRQVSQIFDTIPLIKTAGVSATSVDNPREVSSGDKARSCTASVSMSNGNTVMVTYDITDRGGQYYYQLRVAN